MTLRPSLLLLSRAMCRTEAGVEIQSPVRTLQVESLVEPPEPCMEPAAYGDTLHIHYTGSLVDGHIINTSLSRDPLVLELGQKQVIPERRQGQSFLLTWPVESGISTIHPSGCSAAVYVELTSLVRAKYWQKLVKGILPLVGTAMVPTLLGLNGDHPYKKANRPKVSKKKLKEGKRNNSKKK